MIGGRPKSANGHPDLETSLERIAREQSRRSYLLSALARNSRKSLVNKSLVLALALVSLDSLIVAHYQFDVAQGLIRSTPPVTLLAGVFLNLAPLILPILALGGFARGVIVATQGNLGLGISILLGSIGWYLASAALAPANLFPSIWMPILVISIGVAYSLGQGVDRRWANATAWILGSICCLLLILGVSSLVSQAWGEDLSVLKTAAARPFAPPERLTWSGDPAPTVGYVLQEGPEWVVVLTEGDRKIVTRPKGALRARQICTLTDNVLQSPAIPLITPIAPTKCESAAGALFKPSAWIHRETIGSAGVT